MAIPSLQELCLREHIRKDITEDLDQEKKDTAEQLIESASRSILQKMHEDLSTNIPIINPFKRFYCLYTENRPSIQDKNTSITWNYKNKLFLEFYNQGISPLQNIIRAYVPMLEKDFKDVYQQKDIPEEFIKNLITFLTKNKKELQKAFTRLLPPELKETALPENIASHSTAISAAHSNYWPIIPHLIKSGVNPNQITINSQGDVETFFSDSLEKYSLLVNEALIEAGVNVNQEFIKNAKRFSSEDLAIARSEFATTGSIEPFDLHGIRLSPLEIAAKRCHPELIKLLIQRGADIEKYGKKALELVLKAQRNNPYDEYERNAIVAGAHADELRRIREQRAEAVRAGVGHWLPNGFTSSFPEADYPNEKPEDYSNRLKACEEILRKSLEKLEECKLEKNEQ